MKNDMHSQRDLLLVGYAFTRHMHILKMHMKTLLVINLKIWLLGKQLSYIRHGLWYTCFPGDMPGSHSSLFLLHSSHSCPLQILPSCSPQLISYLFYFKMPLFFHVD